MRSLYEELTEWRGDEMLTCCNCGATARLIMDTSSLNNDVYCVDCAKRSYFDTDGHLQLNETTQVSTQIIAPMIGEVTAKKSHRVWTRKRIKKGDLEFFSGSNEVLQVEETYIADLIDVYYVKEEK